MNEDEVTVAFVCVQNAGRSQMATAFAKRELENRTPGNRVEILTGGTNPADSVHERTVEVMREAGIDLSDRTPREITFEEIQDADIVITMGCSADDVCPATWSGDSRDWDLDDPHGRSLAVVREIRDEIRGRVADLFTELEAGRSAETQ
jgi:protein-tyrosine-phosphatase